MLVGYVSDERYLALADVNVEFHRGGETVAVVRSTARGAVNADLAPGRYDVTLSKAGFGPKTVSLEVGTGAPHQFRLLSDSLYGYVWPKWAKSGESGEYRLHTPEETQITLWRYGLKKELVKVINWHGEHGPRACVQLTPDGDYTQTGVDWNRRGYGNAHLGQAVAAPERSGLYYFHMKSKSGAFFSFPWVVAPAKPTAPIAVLASTNTWNAYNNFGGRSNYICPTHLPAQPVVHARSEMGRYQGTGMGFNYQYKDDEYMPLSFERPEPFNCAREGEQVTDMIHGRNQCHLAPAEWRLLGWLEREGYEYDLYSESQLHKGEIDLDAYKVVILSTHPEYWSTDMYWQMKDWVFKRGGRLMYLGGNGIDAAVVYDDDTRIRILNHWDNVDISGKNPEGTHESRFHRHAESCANLVGVVFTDQAIMTGSPFKVVDDSHWAFKGTGLKNGDLFGIESLHERAHGGASGHEMDRRSRSTPPGARCLAEGINEGGGAEMIHFETESGGEVFSGSSITYGSCLLVDEPLSKVTVNVLNRYLGRE